MVVVKKALVGRAIMLGACAGILGIMPVIVMTHDSVGIRTVVPVFTTLAIIIGFGYYWKSIQYQYVNGAYNGLLRRMESLERSLGEVQGLSQLTRFNSPYPLPYGGGWALTADAASVLAREVMLMRPDIIVELGSGVSTLLTGKILKEIGTGKLFSIEHDPEWAAVTRSHLEALGLTDVVSIVEAPLVEQVINGDKRIWYSVPDEIRILPKIDFLFVDGPPNILDSELSPRYPALPVFSSQLGEHAIVFVDDCHREGESNMVKKWQSEYTGWEVTSVNTADGVCLLNRCSGERK